MELENIMEQIVDKINKDEYGMIRFLQSTAYTNFDFYNFDGLITPEIFIEKFYFENENLRNHKDNLYNFLTHPAGKNTIFIVGYQGCGKTTFINALINHYISREKYDKKNKILINCEKYGVHGESFALDYIFADTLLNYMKNNNDTLRYFCDFFNDNYSVIENFDKNQKLYDFYLFFKDFILRNQSLRNNEPLVKLKRYISDHLCMRELLYLIIFFSLSKYYHEMVKLDPIVIFIDNLDNIDDYSELQKFIKMFDNFTVAMSDNFNLLHLHHGKEVFFRFTHKIKILIAMRETTKANIPSSHFSDAFLAIYEDSRDMTEWYDKSGIVKKRISAIIDDKKLNLSTEKKRQAELINYVVNDIHTKRVLIPLFNNNYRSAIPIITKAVIDNMNSMDEYAYIMKLDEPSFRFGARGMLFKFIFDNFNIEKDGEESYFKKIGVMDLMNRKNDEVSYSRMILSYLSNYTETRCDSSKNCISIASVLRAFEGILDPNLIIKYLWNMFELKDLRWTHLVSFSQIIKQSDKNSFPDIDSFNNLDYENTKLHYSCAGKIYLEYVTTHYEFFTVRVFKEKYRPLYCKDNLNIDTNGNYKFINIIDKVYTEVCHCCASLKEFNKKLCNKFGYPNPYEESNTKYLESPYVCLLKRSDERKFKQFHEDRLINAHIGYIDKFRVFILNYLEISETKKPEINKLLVDRIEKYVNLLGSGILISDYTKETLLGYYKYKIKEINHDFTNYTLEINTHDND